MHIRRAAIQALQLLNGRDQLLFASAILIQMATAVLDLVGVLLIGAVGALAIATVQSQPPPPIVSQLVERMGLEGLSSQETVGILAGLAAVTLLAKSVISALLTRRVLVFLANRQALVSARLARELMSQPLTFVQRRSSHETAYALIYGVGAATSQILGQLLIATSEIAVLALLAVALLLVNPWAAVIALAFCGLIAGLVHRAMGGWAATAGQRDAKANISSQNAIQEALGAYREITVSDRRPFYVQRIQELRWESARVYADVQFMAMFPKYLFESALVLGGLILAAVLFSTEDAVAATGTLALFLAAGTRVMPSLLRLQGAALALRGAAGTAGPTFQLATDLAKSNAPEVEIPSPQVIREQLSTSHRGFSPRVSMKNVTIWYEGANKAALEDISVEIPEGQSIALVGPSGAGKSTLADVLLGILTPDQGSVTVGETYSPVEAIAQWPGAIAYVPQQVLIADDSLRANVALGLPMDAVDDELVWEALRKAHLHDVVRSLDAGLDTRVGEHGMRLSGGQRQRLGIARAMYTRPRLLVLDEATSALDAETEAEFTAMLQDLGGQITCLIIAHRLSTIRNADSVLYLDEGKILGSGSFEDVVAQVPSFASQAKLMGLS